jgi:DNA sulfur modification protein DndD
VPIVIDAPLALLDSIHAWNIISRYFPNASHQVIILSKDTDLKPWSSYYKSLSTNIYNEVTLFFDKINKKTTVLNWYYPNN